jgi:hypothetical protein
MTVRGVARKFFRGEQIEGVWGTEVPQWGPGAKPWKGCGGEAPQKLTTSHSKMLLFKR